MTATKAYGVKDYIMASLLMTLPFIFGFDMSGAKAWFPIMLGGGALVYSLITKYELSAMKLLSLPWHLLLDLCAGIFLAASPWIFGFKDQVFFPHLFFGLVEIGIVLITAFTAEEVKKKIPYLHREVYINPALHN